MAATLGATIHHDGGAGSESMSKLALINPIFLYLSFINLVMLLVQSFGGRQQRE
ncbi:MAG: hypothetical protein R3F54_15250 [Alphaproteobacteria bacterium]